MPTCYLLPDGFSSGIPTHTSKGLVAMVQAVMRVHLQTQRQPQDTQLYLQALAAAQAAPFATPWGVGIAECLLDCLKNTCAYVRNQASSQWLPLAKTLDEVVLGSRIEQDRALAQFRLSLNQLRLACCTEDVLDRNLLLPAQSLIPLLSKLSSQIDNRIIKLLAGSAGSTALEFRELYAVRLATLQKLHQQVYQVLTTAQSIVNLLNNWQDALGELRDMSPSMTCAYFYEDQITTAITYWQALEELLETTSLSQLSVSHEQLKFQRKRDRQRLPVQSGATKRSPTCAATATAVLCA